MSVKLKTAQIKAVREQMLKNQGGKCALTGLPLAPDKAVLDHCHKTGHVRGVIHRGVNSLLGKLENNMARYGVSHTELYAMGRGLDAYLRANYFNNPLHPTHKSEDEKRIRRNTLARKRRVEKKEAL